MTAAPVGHHCPECVAEGRKETRRIRTSLPRFGSVTTTILALNIGIFVLGAVVDAVTGQPESLLRAGAMVPVLVADGEWWRLLTAMFLHHGPLHLLLNSFALYLFGSLVESSLGRVRFVAVYLVTGFVGNATSYAFGDININSAGASGAIFGLLGAWLAFNLRRRSLALARSNAQSALMLIGINLIFGFVVPRIDWLAHVGGLAAGIAGGYASEGVGRRSARTASQVGGLALIAVVGVALVVWRTSILTG